jgi:hypothetical protein
VRQHPYPPQTRNSKQSIKEYVNKIALRHKIINQQMQYSAQQLQYLISVQKKGTNIMKNKESRRNTLKST